jgi:hypothetical protein
MQSAGCSVQDAERVVDAERDSRMRSGRATAGDRPVTALAVTLDRRRQPLSSFSHVQFPHGFLAGRVDTQSVCEVALDRAVSLLHFVE